MSSVSIAYCKNTPYNYRMTRVKFLYNMYIIYGVIYYDMHIYRNNFTFMHNNFNEKNEKLYLIKINYIHIRRKLIKYMKFFIHKYGKCFSFINLFISFFSQLFKSIIDNKIYIYIYFIKSLYISYKLINA